MITRVHFYIFIFYILTQLLQRIHATLCVSTKACKNAGHRFSKMWLCFLCYTRKYTVLSQTLHAAIVVV